MLSQNVIQDVQELMDMVLLEDQRGTETDGPFATGTQKRTWWDKHKFFFILENIVSHKASASCADRV